MNNEYYILEDGEKVGPFSFNELIARGLDVDTPVSTSLSDAWQNASYLPEFNEYFESVGFDFPTEENLAHFGWRTLAFIIDYIIIAVLTMMISLKAGWVTLPPATATFTTAMNMLSQKSMMFFEICFITVFMLYNVLLELLNTSGSIGKKMCGLKLVDADGRKLNFITSFLRTIGALTAFNLFSLVILIVSFFISEQKQTWYDRLAKAYIIRPDTL